MDNITDESPSGSIHVTGTCMDTYRDIASPGVLVSLYEMQHHGMFYNFPYGDFGVKVDSTLSGTDGKFELNYDMKEERSYYVTFSNQFEENKYKIVIIDEDQYEFRPYTRGIYVENGDTEININAYVPNILKIKLHASNNHNKIFAFSTYFHTNQIYETWFVYFYDTDVDSVFILKGRPNSAMGVNFTYYPPNCDSPVPFPPDPRTKTFFVMTDTRDTIPLSYSIDCNDM